MKLIDLRNLRIRSEMLGAALLAATGCASAGGAVSEEAALYACPVRSDAIDLSRAAPKYIGETEKNLRAALAAADLSASELTFDEADALFGKRSEVTDSSDRYANLEVSCLSANGGEQLTGFERRAFISGLDRKVPEAGVIILERDLGVGVLTFRRVSRKTAQALAHDYERACR